MNILHFTPTYLPTVGGAEIYIESLALQQNAVEGDACAVAVMGAKSLPEKSRIELYRVPRFRMGPIDQGLCVKRFRQIALDFKTDIVHCHYGYPTGAVARRAGLPWVITSHGGDLYPHSHHRKKERHWREIKAAYHEAGAVISISPFVEGVLRNELKVPLEKIHSIPNGVDPSPFQEKCEPPEDLHGDPYILFLGRHATVKNAQLLINAFQLLDSGSCHFKLVLAGDGDQRENWQSLGDQLGLSDRVLFPGKVSGKTKIAYFQHARAVAMPSFEEACPIVAIEALMCGRQLITSGIEAFSHFMDPTLPHLQLPTDDAQAWADAISALSTESDPEMTKQIAAQSKQFTLEKNRQAHMDLYQKVLG